MTKDTLTVAAAQMCSTDDLRANLDTCAKLAAQAAAAGAEVLVLPECFAFLGRSERDKLAVAEDLEASPPGPIVSSLTELATRHQMWVLAGGMPERVADDPNRALNAFVAIDPSGELVGVYRKVHLFDIDIPGRATLRESDSTRAGTDLVSLSLEPFVAGLAICYDLRFPELFRQLVVDCDANILMLPAAFTAHTGAAHWHTLLRARAIENQCYVVAAAQWGQHNEKRASYGHTLIYDPWGELVGELPSGDGIVTATLSMELLRKTRSQMPCLDHQVLLG